MKTQNKHGVIFFILSFAIVLTFFSFFIPKSSKQNRLAENAQQEINTIKGPYGKNDIPVENPQQKLWEMDSSAANSANQSQEQTSWDNGTTTAHQQEIQNNNVTTTQTYTHPQTTYYDNSYSESESNKYVYRTRPTEDTNSRTSNDYYQNTDSYSSSKTRYDDYATANNPTPITVPTPTPQPTHMTSCDGSGCWDNQGNRYAGNNGTYYQSNGGMCRDIGGMVQCN